MRGTVLVSGMVAADPHQGGAAWAVMQYVLGFRRLGWRVCLVEPISPGKLRPAGTTLAASVNAQYFRRLLRAFGFTDAALLLAGTRETVGLTYDAIRAAAGDAAALFNVSGMLADPALLGPIPVRVYLDLDPAFIQVWHAQGVDMRFAAHTHFVTVGQAIGRPECPVPTAGLPWRATLPPVVLDRWPVAARPPTLGLTTVGNWRSYGSVEWDAVRYGQKAHSVRELIGLPAHLGEPVTLATTVHPGDADDRAALDAHGWRLADPVAVAGTPGRYRRFVARSAAEIGIAKSGYVKSRCGWFSDRTAVYLASGRPAVAQDTGFSAFLPTGDGLFAFDDAGDAARAVEAIRSDPARHARAARRLAEEHLDSDRVLGRLLRLVGVR